MIRQFMLGAIAFQQRQAIAFQDLSKRGERIDLTSVLTPLSLTSPADRAAGRATMAQYRSMLAERKLLMQTYLLEYERFLADLPPGKTRNLALAGMGGASQAGVKLYGDLDRTQTGLVDAMEAVMNWGQSQASHLGIRGGQLLFETKEQQTELQELLTKVAAAETEVLQTTQLAAASMTQAQEQMKTNIQQAERFLAN